MVWIGRFELCLRQSLRLGQPVLDSSIDAAPEMGERHSRFCGNDIKADPVSLASVRAGKSAMTPDRGPGAAPVGGAVPSARPALTPCPPWHLPPAQPDKLI